MITMEKKVSGVFSKCNEMTRLKKFVTSADTSVIFAEVGYFLVKLRQALFIYDNAVIVHAERKRFEDTK